MLTYTRIKELCKAKKVTISAIERELGFAKGSLCKIDTNKPSNERVQKIANFFNISVDELNNDVSGNVKLNTKDERDIADSLDKIMGLLDSGDDGPVRFNGQEIDYNSRILLRNAIELGLTQLKIENKELYNPSKNKK